MRELIAAEIFQKFLNCARCHNHKFDPFHRRKMPDFMR